MAIYHGGGKIKDVYFGSQKIKEVYFGPQLVYSSKKEIFIYNRGTMTAGNSLARGDRSQSSTSYVEGQEYIQMLVKQENPYGDGGGYMETTSAIDLTDIKSISMVASNIELIPSTYSGNKVSLKVDQQQNRIMNSYAKRVVVQGNFLESKIGLDVSELSGYHYITAALLMTGSGASQFTQEFRLHSLSLI